MKKAANYIKNKLSFLLAVTLAAVVGGATTAVVMAAVPDSNGVIHGCIRPINNNLRIIDTEAGQTCTGGQTPINWDQSGWKGYGHILAYDNTLDMDSSKNVTAVTSFQDPSTNSAGFCIFTNSNLSLISVSNTVVTSSGVPGAVNGAVRSSNLDGQSYVNPAIDQYCGTDAKAIIFSGESSPAGGIDFFFR